MESAIGPQDFPNFSTPEGNVMTQEEVNEWFEDHAADYQDNDLHRQFVLVAEETEDQGGATLRRFEVNLKKYRSTYKLTGEQRTIARSIYRAFIKGNRFDGNDGGWNDYESIDCSYSALLPRSPLPAGLHGPYDLSDCDLQLQMEKRYWALPYDTRVAAFLWTCRGCYRKALHRMEVDDENFDGQGDIQDATYTDFNIDYIKCSERAQAAEEAKEAAAAGS